MSVELVDDPARFLLEASPLLLADEARHNLILGLAGTLRSTPDVYPERSLWLVYDGGIVVAAALRTPPYNAVIARPLDEAALDELVAAIDELPGVVGAVPEVDAFAERWCVQRGARARLVFGQGIFALTAVADLPRFGGTPRGDAGRLRPAGRLVRGVRARGAARQRARARAARAPDPHAPRLERRWHRLVGGRRRRRIALRLRLADAERDPHRAGLYAARAARPRVCDDADGRRVSRAARTRTAVLLPLH